LAVSRFVNGHPLLIDSFAKIRILDHRFSEQIDIVSARASRLSEMSSVNWFVPERQWCIAAASIMHQQECDPSRRNHAVDSMNSLVDDRPGHDGHAFLLSSSPAPLAYPNEHEMIRGDLETVFPHDLIDHCLNGCIADLALGAAFPADKMVVWAHLANFVERLRSACLRLDHQPQFDEQMQGPVDRRAIDRPVTLSNRCIDIIEGNVPGPIANGIQDHRSLTGNAMPGSLENVLPVQQVVSHRLLLQIVATSGPYCEFTLDSRCDRTQASTGY
jgi:hypothetical protein